MKGLIQLLTMVSLTLIAYFPAMDAGIILDDELFFLNDPLTSASDGLEKIWLKPLENNKIWSYVPISRSSFWLEKQIWGTDIAVSHLINVLLHLLSAIILWRTLQYCNIRGAWLIGVVFALHPVHVQSVVWIAERRNVLASVFYLTAMWAYLHFDKKKQGLWYWLALVLFAGALLSKTSTIMMPLVLIFCLLWIHKNLKKIYLFRLLPFFFLSLAAGVIRIWFENTLLGATRLEESLSFGERLSVAAHVPFFYLKKLFIPYPLVFTYPKWQFDPGEIFNFFPLITLTVSSAILLWKYHSWGKPIFIGLCVFVATLFPVLGFFNIAWTQFSYVSDHWVYLPCLPVLVLAVNALLIGRKMVRGLKQSQNQYKFWALGSALLIGLGSLTWNQTLIYKNQKTLNLATIRHNPNSWLAHTVLGEESLKEKNYQQAVEYSNKALQLKHNNIFALINRGLAYFHQGRIELAVRDFDEALQIDPDSVEASFNRGMAYAWSQKYEEAINDYNLVLKMDPRHLQALNNRASLYFQLKFYENAIKDYTAVLKLDPSLAEAYYNRGVVNFFLKRYQQTLIDNEHTLKLNPDHTGALKMKNTLIRFFAKSKN
ncbi:MAG: tetratricopeptide repeat protein [SAR324 cluster bacterium]|nr:tetratricopeptide repeat protein [SAR324 cluster bacterium]